MLTEKGPVSARKGIEAVMSSDGGERGREDRGGEGRGGGGGRVNQINKVSVHPCSIYLR
jgi:hypothetical protein